MACAAHPRLKFLDRGDDVARIAADGTIPVSRPLRHRLGDVLRSRAGARIIRLVERTPLRRYLFSGAYDPQTGFVIGKGDMERDWDERARLNPRYFIAVMAADSEQEFLESGERDLAGLLEGCPLPPDARVLEIGCGIGRLLRPLAARAAEVHGVDISGEMIRQGREALADLPNVHLHQTSGDLSMFDDGYFDFCCSVLVFRHIPHAEAVRRYIREAARVLRSGGIFRFEIALADGESPRTSGGGTWFGVIFREAEVRDLLETLGFDIVNLASVKHQDQLWLLASMTVRKR
jgi:SAM-dependent methyltransferase